MNITKENKEDLTAILKVEVAPEDYRGQVNEILKDYARKANIKGFRKGKVPVSVVKRMYGKGVVFEELNKVLTENLQSYIRDEKLNLVGDPLPRPVDELDLDPDKDETHTFEYEIGLAPDFGLNLEVEGRPVRHQIEVDDETLEDEVKAIQKRYGEMTNPDEAEAEDTLFGKLSELDAEGNLVEEGLSRMIALNPDRVPADSVKAQFAGRKAEDTFDVKMSEVLTGDDEIRKFWQTNVQGEQVRELNEEDMTRIMDGTFRFEVKKINRMGKMELGEELYKKVFGNDEITTEEAFREKIREDLGAYLDGQAESFYKGRTLKALVEGNEIPLPDEFLKRWLIQSDEQTNESNVEQRFEDYARSLRWSLIIDHLQAEDENLRVTQEDMQDHARIVISREIRPYMPNATDEQLDGYVNHYLNDERMRNRIFQEVLDAKIFQHLNTVSPPQEEKVTAKAFMEIVKAEN